jgi:hypothetical protein
MSRLLQQLASNEPLELVELAALKGTSRNAILRLVKGGQLAHTIVDGQVRVRPSDFDAHVNSGGARR